MASSTGIYGDQSIAAQGRGGFTMANSVDRAEARLEGPTIRYNLNGKGQAPMLTDATLHMVLNVQTDQHFKTRLQCEARTYLKFADRSILASKIHFSIFSGKPSQSFPSADNKLDQWVKEWLRCSVQDEPYKLDAAIKEHVYAVRAFYKKTGLVFGASNKDIKASPHDNDTLIYISKIAAELAAAGKGLLRPTLNLLYQATTHRDIHKLCRISGPVCYVLEPGYINTDENALIWPLEDGETEDERSERVTQTLKEDVYPKVNYEVYRENYTVGGGVYTHTYMGRRLMFHPPEAGSPTGKFEPLSSDYPPEPVQQTQSNTSKKPARVAAHSTSKRRVQSLDQRRQSSSSVSAHDDTESEYEEETRPTSRKPKSKPKPRRSSKRKADDDSDSDYHECSKPTRKRQKKNTQPSEGARPTRSNSIPTKNISKDWGDNTLATWFL